MADNTDATNSSSANVPSTTKGSKKKDNVKVTNKSPKVSKATVGSEVSAVINNADENVIIAADTTNSPSTTKGSKRKNIEKVVKSKSPKVSKATVDTEVTTANNNTDENVIIVTDNTDATNSSSTNAPSTAKGSKRKDSVKIVKHKSPKVSKATVGSEVTTVNNNADENVIILADNTDTANSYCANVPSTTKGSKRKNNEKVVKSKGSKISKATVDSDVSAVNNNTGEHVIIVADVTNTSSANVPTTKGSKKKNSINTAQNKPSKKLGNYLYSLKYFN